MLVRSVLAFVVIAGVIGRGASDGPRPRRAYREGAVIAKPRAAQSAGLERTELAERVRVRERFARLGDLRVLELDASESVGEAVARLQATGRYEFVEPDYLVYPTATPNDPKFSTQWPLDNRRQDGSGVVGADIKALAAWDIVREAPSVVVAVIDSGMRLDHVDLAPNLWRNPRPAFGDVNGARFIDGARSGDVTDDTGHGTGVAGVIGAAGNNGAALAGVAWRVQLMPIKVFSAARGFANVSDVVAAIDYAVAQGAHIVNCSFGAAGALPQSELAAVKAARDAGILVVCSSGNDGSNIDDTPVYPASLLVDNVITVGNSDQSDVASTDSNYGAIVDLFAPGRGVPTLDYRSVDGVQSSNGTSISAPHVAGALALLKARFPAETPRQLVNRLLRGTEVRPGLAGKAITGGRLNLLRALQSTTNRPLNDDYTERLTISGSGAVVRTNNRDATAEPGEPAHAGWPAANTLWWQWTAPHSSSVRITTAGSEFDTTLAVYTGDSLSALTPVASNDDAFGVVTSAVSFSARAGTTYRIALSGKNGAAGAAVLNVALAPVNDDFAAAAALSGLSDRATGTLRHALRENAEPFVMPQRGAASVWYRWTAPRSGRYHVSSVSLTTDVLLAVYTGSSLETLNPLTTGESLFDGEFHARCSFEAIAGTSYAIQVDTRSADRAGDFVMTLVDAEWATHVGIMGGAPSVARDGTIYVCENGGAGRVQAVTPDGQIKWKTEVGFMGWVSAAVGAEGTIFVGAGGKVAALAPDGSIRWQRPLASDHDYGSVRIAADGTLYVQPGDTWIYALDPADGRTRWRSEVGSGYVRTDPVIAGDGTIYFVGGNQLHALTPAGTLKWRRPIDTSRATVAIDFAGNIYFAGFPGIVSLTPENAVRWTYTPPAGASLVFSNPVLSADGRTIYLGAGEELLALDTTRGTRVWACALRSNATSTTPAVDTDGSIYIGTDDGRVCAVDRNGALKRVWWTGARMDASLTIFGSTLLAASVDRTLYAFDIGAFAAGGPWPQEGQNVRHTGRAETDALAITVPPQSFNGLPGDSLVLHFVALGQGPFTYLWRKDGVVIAGATSVSYAVHAATESDSGTYTVTVMGPQGTVTSLPAVVAIVAPPPPPPRLVNLSVRGTAGPGDRVLFVGYTVGGVGTSGTPALLIRAMGPALGAFGVADALAMPRLQLFSGPTLLADNSAWGGDAQIAALATRLGAFPFAGAQSRDAALVTTRPAAGYTVQISSTNGAVGTALAEIYDTIPAADVLRTTPRLMNLSARGRAGPGAEALIAGFAIEGRAAKRLLIRAIGPTLAAFGVTDFLREPQLELFRSSAAQAFASAGRWGASSDAAEIVNASQQVGAFALPFNSADSAVVITLDPGNYTAHATGAGNSAGSVVLEIYELP